MLRSLTLLIVFSTTVVYGADSSGCHLEKQLSEVFKTQEKPVTFTTPQMIEAARKRVAAKTEPWFCNYERIKGYADASFSCPIVPYTDCEVGDKDPNGVHDVACTDFCAARGAALVWLIEGDKKYLEQAKAILLAWARAMPEPIVHLQSRREYPYYDADLGLLGGVPMVFYSHAYTLIYDQFDAAEHKDIQLWLNKVAVKLKYWHLAWTANNYYGNQYFNNHLSWHNASIAYIGFALHDARMAAFAIDDTENPRDFKEMLAGAILMPGDDTHDAHKDTIAAGEIYDRYRSVKEHKGLSYAMFHGMALTYLAEAAYNNGIDLYNYTAPGGENLFLLYSYYAEFITKNDSVLKNGLYKGDKVPTPYVPIYDLINTRYPGHGEIEAVIKTHGRCVDMNKCQHAGTIGLTHIVPMKD